MIQMEELAKDELRVFYESTACVGIGEWISIRNRNMDKS